MTFLSVSSGISAASEAWAPLGWKACAFSEIEPFPCAVLAHHHPDTPNLGDMTKFHEWPRTLRPDILEGGTPCQGFSVAGLRKGLADPRSRLSLTFVEIAALYRPAWLVWENVPGVLSSEGGADFAAFLGALTGRDVPIPRDGFQNSGHIEGIPDAYGIAWRVLDAQFAGVPQRRRRVFVVGYLGDWRRGAVAVLFERESLLGNPPPRREAGEGTAGTLTSRAGNGSRPAGANGNLIPEVAGTIQANGKAAGSATSQDADQGNLIPVHTTGAGFWKEGLGTLRAREQDSHENLVAFSGRARGDDGRGYDRPPQVFTDGIVGALDTVKPHCVAFSCKDHGADAGDIAPTLRSMGHDGSHANGGGQIAVAFTQNSRSEVRVIGGDGQVAGAVTADPGEQCQNYIAAQHALVFEPRCARNGRGMPEEICPPLKAQSGETGKGDAAPCVAIAFHGSQDPDVSGDITHPCGRNSGLETCVATFQQSSQSGKGTIGYDTSGIAKPVKTQQDGQMIQTGYVVRRLTPTECERLQGFPDGHTQLPDWNGWRPLDDGEDPEELIAQGFKLRINSKTGKARVNDPDGPRYKALGNSMAVPVMRWIGQRIAAVEKLSPGLPLSHDPHNP